VKAQPYWAGGVIVYSVTDLTTTTTHPPSTTSRTQLLSASTSTNNVSFSVMSVHLEDAVLSVHNLFLTHVPCLIPGILGTTLVSDIKGLLCKFPCHLPQFLSMRGHPSYWQHGCIAGWASSTGLGWLFIARMQCKSLQDVDYTRS
jgi:hypothetical protein